MNWSIILALVAAASYGLQNATIDIKLKDCNVAAMGTIIYAIMLPVFFLRMCFEEDTAGRNIMPNETELLWIFAAALVYIVADYTFFASYLYAKGSVYMITACVATIPGWAALAKLVWEKSYPTVYHIAGWVTIFLGVLVVLYGEKLRTGTE